MRAIYVTSLSNEPCNAEHLAHSGQPVSATPLPEALYDRAETGPMYAIEAADGWKSEAFADELTPV